MKTFVVCHRGALGDFVCTWNSLRLARQLLPEMRFLGIGKPSYMQLAVDLGLLDEWMDAEKKELMPFFAAKAVPRQLGEIGGAVLFLAHSRSIQRLLQLSGVRGPVAAVTPFPDIDYHISDYYMTTLAGVFGVEKSATKNTCLLMEDNADIDSCNDVVIHPGSGSVKKNYSPAFYKEIAACLMEMGVNSVKYLLGPAEEQLHDLFPAFRRLCGFSIGRVARYLQCRTKCYIGNDSGITHLAAALGVNVFALYKHTNPAVWGARGACVTLIDCRNKTPRAPAIARMTMDKSLTKKSVGN